jgi:hypothetical protein
MTMRRSLLLAAPICLLALASCQRRGEPVPTLTQEQWARVQENFLTTAPVPQHPVGAVFGDEFRLIGWEMSPAAPQIDEAITITLIWESLAEVDTNWRIFTHLDGTTRQNLDHDAMANAFPTLHWKKGTILKDTIETKLETGGDGQVKIFVGFYHDDDRLEVSSPGSGKVDKDGRLEIGGFAAKWEPPAYEIKRASSPITIDGKLTDRAWVTAAQTVLWRHPTTGKPQEGIDTWAKMLWDDENLYVAFSAEDSDVWSTITARDGNLWDEEVLELYIDAKKNGTDYLEFQINPNNAVFDAFFPKPTNRNLEQARARNLEKMESAVTVSGTLNKRDDEDRAWFAELRIPLASIPSMGNVPPRDGDTVRVNFYRYDRPSNGEVNTLAWSPIGGGSFHKPERFGVATFTGAGTPLMPGMVEGSGIAVPQQLLPTTGQVKPLPSGNPGLRPVKLPKLAK